MLRVGTVRVGIFRSQPLICALLLIVLWIDFSSSTFGVEFHGSSQYYMNSGYESDMFTYDDSLVEFSGGTVGNIVWVYDRSIVNVSESANIGYGLFTFGGTINMQGGSTARLFASVVAQK